MVRNRDGSADTGVSMLMLFWCCCGGGRANGFGGPVAPADKMADAEGDGGGRTMPDECESVGLRRVDWDPASVVEFFGEADSAVALAPSEASSGISTRSRGRDAPPPPIRRLFCRDGGVKVVSGTDDIESLGLGIVCVLSERLGMGGELEI